MPSFLILCRPIEDGAALAARLPTEFRVRFASTERFEQLVAADAPDLVIVDYGPETVSVSRSLKTAAPLLPVIAVIDDATRLEAIRAGVDHCLTRPIAIDELVARATRLLETGARHRAFVDKLEQVRGWHDWVRHVVHELRNPVTVALGTVSLARTGDTSLKADADLEEAERALEELATTLRDLLDADRILHGILVPRFEPIDLASLVVDVSNGLSLESSLDLSVAGDTSITVDPLLIGRVFGNLIVNADRHAVSEPVRVQIAGSATGVSVHITNDGPGIATELASYLFEPWRKITSPTHPPGIGLAFCRLVCEAHAGKLWLDSGAAGNVTFAFDLPRVKGRG